MLSGGGGRVALWHHLRISVADIFNLKFVSLCNEMVGKFAGDLFANGHLQTKSLVAQSKLAPRFSSPKKRMQLR